MPIDNLAGLVPERVVSGAGEPATMSYFVGATMRFGTDRATPFTV